MTSIKDFYGNKIDFEAAVNLMNDDIREAIANTGDFDDDPQGFAEAYAREHEAAFGEEFAPMCGGEW